MLDMAFGTVTLAEALWFAIEAVGLWYVYRIWRGAGRQAAVADAYRRAVSEASDVLEAEAMQEIAADRQQRNAVLVAILLAGVILGAWSMIVPQPVRAELQAFHLGATLVFLLRDGLLVLGARRSYRSGERTAALLRQRRAVVEGAS